MRIAVVFVVLLSVITVAFAQDQSATQPDAVKAAERAVEAIDVPGNSEELPENVPPEIPPTRVIAEPPLPVTEPPIAIEQAPNYLPAPMPQQPARPAPNVQARQAQQSAVQPAMQPITPAGPQQPTSVVTPNRFPTPLSQNSSSLSVVTREQIQQSGRTQVLEVLRTLPGVDVVQSGGAGRQASLFSRGANSNHTKVLLDGIPINDPVGNRGFDFSTLNIDNVDKIEVLRGPQSTLYGSDAIGGVVNIVTRRGDGPAELRLRSMGGSFGTGHNSATLSGGSDEFYYSLNGSYFQSYGFSAAANGTENDAFRNSVFSGRIGSVVSDSLTLDYVFRYSNANAEIDGFDFATGLPADDTISENLSETFFNRIQATHTSFDGDLTNRFGFSYANFNRDATGGFPSFFDAETTVFDWQAKADLITADEFQLSAIGGVDLKTEEGITSFQPNSRLRNAAGYGQLLLVQNALSLSAGARHDDYNLAGSANTWRTTGRYDIRESGTAFHAAAGTGFRAPALNELFDPFFGNVNLRPETSRGWEAGVEQRLTPNSIVDVTYFDNDFDDLVVFTFDPVTGFRPRNINSASAQGVEVSGSILFSQSTWLTGGYTYTRTQDESTGLDLLRRPRNKYNVGLNHRFASDRALFSSNFRWVDDRSDFGGFQLNDYSVLDAALSYDLSPSLRVFGRVDNVLDRRYQEVAGFNTPKLSAYVGAEVILGGRRGPSL